jgi:hypothetical protein
MEGSFAHFWSFFYFPYLFQTLYVISLLSWFEDKLFFFLVRTEFYGLVRQQSRHLWLWDLCTYQDGALKQRSYIVFWFLHLWLLRLVVEHHKDCKTFNWWVFKVLFMLLTLWICIYIWWSRYLCWNRWFDF